MCIRDSISTQEACTVTQKLDLDQMSEKSIRTLNDTNMIKLTLSVANFGFIRFVWPYLDDSDDICDLKWRIKCPRNFRPTPWILPSRSLHLPDQLVSRFGLTVRP